MLKTARLAAILAAAALAAGCFEGKADFTFNPDGTGKVVGEILFPTRAPWLQKPLAPKPADAGAPAAAPATSSDDEMRECVAAIIKRSSGIEAWKDVSFQRGPDGRVLFKGTAYFKDLSKVKLFPDDRAGRISYGPDGTTAATLILARAKPAIEPPKPSRPVTPEEIGKRIKDIRDKYQVAKGTLTSELPGMKVDLVFHAPGALEEVRGLEQQGMTLSFTTEGARVLQAMDAQVADSTVARQWVLAGKAPPAKDLMNDKVFGAKGEVWARWKGPFRPRFDYQEEMAAAKKAQPQMMVKLGLEKPRENTHKTPAPAPAKESPTPKKDAATPKAPAAPKAQSGI